MKKPADLRAHLEASVPALAADPDKLSVFIERGQVAARLGAGLSFEYRYDLVLLITDFAGHADSVMVPLLAWIARHQPDLMHHPERAAEAIRLEAELIDNDRVDLELKIALTEAVVVAGAAGRYTATHVEPPPLPDLGGATGWDLYAGGELIVA